MFQFELNKNSLSNIVPKASVLAGRWAQIAVPAAGGDYASDSSNRLFTLFEILLPQITIWFLVAAVMLSQIIVPSHAQNIGDLSSVETESAIESSSTAVIDPDRHSTTPTGWVWWKHRTEDEINSIRDNDKMRLIDLEQAPTNDGRYDVVFVRNSGEYQRDDGWWYGYSRDGVVSKIDEINGRITDLEPYTVNGQRRFAFSTVRNEGSASKFWWWNFDLTAAQVTQDINTHGIRLIDLDAYMVDGETRYSYVGIRNQGVDQMGWWWYHNVSFQYVKDRINEHNARLVDIERHSNGNISVIMVENLDGTSWWWGAGVSQTWMEEIIATTSSRLVDVESTVINGERVFDFITIDNANAETRRLRELIYQAYDAPEYGDQEIRGFLVKEVGGDVLADQAGDFRFQPVHMSKLLPYLYAMIEIENGRASMDGSTASWIETVVDNVDTSIDERKYENCLTADAPSTQIGSAPFADALPTMMWEPHNRTLDYFLEAYGPTNITARVQELGLTKTEIHFGCPQPSDPDPTPWLANRSTLYDIAKLYEGVELLEFVSQPSTRSLFFDNMTNLTYSGASYTSPITDKTSGPSHVQFLLREIVEREAGIAKESIVEEFLQNVVVREKEGTGVPNHDEHGFSNSLHVTLPFKENGQIVTKTFVVGWFVYKLRTPDVCRGEEEAFESAECLAIRQPEQADLWNFEKEIHTLPIRMALETWGPDSASASDIQIWHAWDGEAEAILQDLPVGEYQSESVSLRKFEDSAELLEELRTVNDFSDGPHIVLGPDGWADELLDLRFSGAYCLPGECPTCEGPNPPAWCSRAQGDFSGDINQRFNVAGLCSDVEDCPCSRENPPNWCWAAQLAPDQLPESGIDIFQASFARQFDNDIFPLGIPIYWNYMMVVANPAWFIEQRSTTPTSIDEIIELNNKHERLLRIINPGYVDPPPPGVLKKLFDLDPNDPSPHLNDAGILLVPANRFVELSQQIDSPTLMVLDDYHYQPQVQGSFVNINMDSAEREAALSVAYQISKADTQRQLVESVNLLPAHGVVWKEQDESVSVDLATMSIEAFAGKLGSEEPEESEEMAVFLPFVDR